MNILYIAIIDKTDKQSAFVLHALIAALKNHQLSTYGDLGPVAIAKSVNTATELNPKDGWDIVLIQNSRCFIRYASIIYQLKKNPFVFVSVDNNIGSYISAFDNLYGVFNFGKANLKHWGVPTEMQTPMYVPIDRSPNHFRLSENKSCYEIVYFSNPESVHILSILLPLSLVKNIRFTVVANDYSVLKSALNTNVRIVSEEKFAQALRKAHVVLASNYNAVRAMAYGKPCVILGNYGLSGRVCKENYESLKKYEFRGRIGGSYNEFIPIDLLNAEIQKAIQYDHSDDVQWLRRKVLADYDIKKFVVKVENTLNQILHISGRLSRRKSMVELKPFLTDIFEIKEIDGEIDDELLKLLFQCDGIKTIGEIMKEGGYDNENEAIFSANLKELWKKKLVMFK